MNQRQATALQLLDHYIVLLMERAGLKPDADTHAELAELVDNLVTAAVEEATDRIVKNLRAQKNRTNAARRTGGKP